MRTNDADTALNPSQRGSKCSLVSWHADEHLLLSCKVFVTVIMQDISFEAPPKLRAAPDACATWHMLCERCASSPDTLGKPPLWLIHEEGS